MKTTDSTPYNRALKKVENIKKFYAHLRAYLIINLVLLLIKANIFDLFKGGNIEDLHFERWLDLNVYGTAILWGIGLLIHGLYVFQYKFKFFKKWEEEKVKEFMENDNNNL